MGSHSSVLRPVTREDGDTWRTLPLLREAWRAWGAGTPEVWMLWCRECQRVIPGTEMPHTADCDVIDLLSRRGEYTEWERACQKAHQANPSAATVQWVHEPDPAGDTTGEGEFRGTG